MNNKSGSELNMDESSLLREIGDLQATNSHLQKVVDEQKAKITMLNDEIEGRGGHKELSKGLNHQIGQLKAQVEEQKGEIERLKQLCIDLDERNLEDNTDKLAAFDKADELESQLAEQTERGRVMREALSGLLERYVGLVNSGDAGNWDPEIEDEVKQARQALNPKESK